MVWLKGWRLATVRDYENQLEKNVVSGTYLPTKPVSPRRHGFADV